MLPLYLDYLERPSIYEGFFYKELGIIPEKGSITEDVVVRIRNKLEETSVSDYGKKKAARDAKRALKRKSTGNVKLKAVHKSGNMKLKASHKTAAQIAKDRKIKDLTSLDKKTRELTGKVKPKVAKIVKTVKPTVAKLKPAVKKVVPKAASTLKPFMKKAGMVGAGAAAAYGGYKFYKRYLSKAAKKCQGKSGSEKTLCLKQNARPNYAN